MATTVVNCATYFNIGGGGQKQCSSLYMNSGGTRKSISYAHANITGVRKQIFPYSVTTTYTYTWERWSVNETQTDAFDYVYDAEEDIDDYGDYSENFSYPTCYYSKTGFYGSGNTLYLENPVTSTKGSFGIPQTSSSSPFYALQGQGFGAISYESHSRAGSRTHILEFYCTKNGIFPIQIIYAYYTGGASTIYSKGSSYYGTVTSTNSTEYPSDGYSGGYWYVYIGRS